MEEEKLCFGKSGAAAPPEFARRHAERVAKRLGKLGCIVIAEFAGNLQHTAVGFDKPFCRRLHFLRADKGVQRRAVNCLETVSSEVYGDRE